MTTAKQTLNLMADYDCWPQWQSSSDGATNVDPADLPITPALRDVLCDWTKQRDSRCRQGVASLAFGALDDTGYASTAIDGGRVPLRAFVPLRICSGRVHIAAVVELAVERRREAINAAIARIEVGRRGVDRDWVLIDDEARRLAVFVVCAVVTVFRQVSHRVDTVAIANNPR